MNVIDVTTKLLRVSDFAAAIANLDVIVSTDGWIAHLAGAMARPVWTLLPFSPDVRWMLARADTPWYPTMRLFRQPTAGDWRTPIHEVTAALAQLAASGNAV
jgi:ADP-heptose:LPS heptosyltransferase